jgi:hypothetical protein
MHVDRIRIAFYTKPNKGKRTGHALWMRVYLVPMGGEDPVLVADTSVDTKTVDILFDTSSELN